MFSNGLVSNFLCCNLCIWVYFSEYLKTYKEIFKSVFDFVLVLYLFSFQYIWCRNFHFLTKLDANGFWNLKEEYITFIFIGTRNAVFKISLQTSTTESKRYQCPRRGVSKIEMIIIKNIYPDLKKISVRSKEELQQNLRQYLLITIFYFEIWSERSFI